MTTARCAAVLDGDTEALELLGRGDASAGRVCIERFGPLVWSIALRMCRDRTDAEDATEDVFMELWKAAGRFDPSRSGPRVFVAMITRRRLIDRARPQRRHTVGQVPLSDAVTESRTSIGSPVGASEETSAAMAQIQQLSPEQQSVIRLAVGESWTHERIAEHLNMPVGTVKTHLRRGLIAIREALARERRKVVPGVTDVPRGVSEDPMSHKDLSDREHLVKNMNTFSPPTAHGNRNAERSGADVGKAAFHTPDGVLGVLVCTRTGIRTSPCSPPEYGAHQCP